MRGETPDYLAVVEEPDVAVGEVVGVRRLQASDLIEIVVVVGIYKGRTFYGIAKKATFRK